MPFEHAIKKLQSFIKQVPHDNIRKQHKRSYTPFIYASSKKEIILTQNVGRELGHPKNSSLAFIAWTQHPVEKDQITLIGKDLSEASEIHMDFGKVIMLTVTDFDADNTYDRYQELDLLRFTLNLHGYMMRAASQQMREWSRISKSAVKKGLSLFDLGSAWIDLYGQLPYVTAVEVLLITDNDYIKQLNPISQHVFQYVQAMMKMHDEVSLDCSSCEYQTVCNDVQSLRTMRKNILDKRLEINNNSDR
jgi:CO dehydrogenase/acetyl-CoA synthase beta subunit